MEVSCALLGRRTGVAQDEVKHIEVLAAKNVAVTAAVVRVAVADGGRGGAEQQHVRALWQRIAPHPAPLPHAQRKRLDRLRDR
jgi:hypothetical protein